MGCSTMRVAIWARRTIKPSSLAKLFVSRTKWTSFRPPSGSKTCLATTEKSSRLWLRFARTKVSYAQTAAPHSFVDGFYVDHGDSTLDEESIDRLWLVVRSLKNPEGKFDYKIKKFDTIKLGRVRFRVKDFRCE